MIEWKIKHKEQKKWKNPTHKKRWQWWWQHENTAWWRKEKKMEKTAKIKSSLHCFVYYLLRSLWSNDDNGQWKNFYFRKKNRNYKNRVDFKENLFSLIKLFFSFETIFLNCINLLCSPMDLFRNFLPSTLLLYQKGFMCKKKFFLLEKLCQ